MDCLRCKEEMIKAKLKGDAVGKLRLTQWEISLAIWELEALSSVSTDILIL